MAHRLLLLAALLAQAGRLAAATATQDPGFDLFIFVRSYSPTFCRETACSINPISAFTVHGLWPEFNTGSWPEFCGGDRASGGSSALPAAGDAPASLAQAATGAIEQQRQEQQEELGEGSSGVERRWQRRHHRREQLSGGDSGGGASTGSGSRDAAAAPRAGADVDDPSEQQKCEWPSFKGPDRSFWDHEWARHGTCARPITGDRPSFFNTTLRLHEQYDLDSALSDAGIEPSDRTSYSRRQMEGAVRDAFGQAPLLSCFHGQLSELWLCVGLDLKLVKCPAAVKSHRPACGDRISLPVGSPVSADCRPYIPPWGAPSGGNRGTGIIIRIATGAAVAGAAAAAVALFVAGATRRGRQRLPDVPAERYDPLLRYFSGQEKEREPSTATIYKW